MIVRASVELLIAGRPAQSLGTACRRVANLCGASDSVNIVLSPHAAGTNRSASAIWPASPEPWNYGKQSGARHSATCCCKSVGRRYHGPSLGVTNWTHQIEDTARENDCSNVLAKHIFDNSHGSVDEASIFLQLHGQTAAHSRSDGQLA